jgi:peptidoglycan/LPS O-acetylase OafA/YrhL
MLGAAFAMVWRPLALLRGPMRRKGHLLDAIALVGLARARVAAWRTSTWPSLRRRSSPGRSSTRGCSAAGFLLTARRHAARDRGGDASQGMAGAGARQPGVAWAGTRSYGLYLYHWPVYQVIRREAGVALRPVSS